MGRVSQPHVLMANGLRRDLLTHQTNYDVVVIGAGPAGSRTAKLLADRGYRVAILERDTEVGLPVHCTGVVSSECMERYDLPESLVIRPIKSFVLRSPHGHAVDLKRKEVQAYVLDRVSLDRHMAGQAVAAGADLITGVEVTDVRWDGKNVRVTSRGGLLNELTARIAVLATGYGSALARALGLGGGAEVVSGAQAVVKASLVQDLEVFTGKETGKGGFGWLLPWKPGLALTGVLTRKHTVRYLNEQIERLQRQGKVGEVHELFRCRPVPLQVAKTAVQDGILGVGDVVGQVKPTTGGGIYYGLLGADIAGAVIHDALMRGDATTAALQPYETQWRQLMEPEIRRGYLLRRLGEQLPETVVEQLHRLLRIPALRRIFVSARPSYDWHSAGLLRVLDRFQRYS